LFECGRWLLFEEEDPTVDAPTVDEVASALATPGRRVENFFRMKDSVGAVVVGVGVAVAVAGGVGRDFPHGLTMG
jgi:hypothetical protein